MFVNNDLTSKPAIYENRWRKLMLQLSFAKVQKLLTVKLLVVIGANIGTKDLARL